MSDIAIPSPSYRMRVERPGIPIRMLLIAGGALAAVGLVAAVTWGVSRIGPRGVPVIEPDSRPLKVRPDNPGGLVVPNQDETIFERQAGRGNRPVAPAAASSQLAPAPEAPQVDLLRQQVAPPAPAAVPAPAAAPPAVVPAAVTPAAGTPAAPRALPTQRTAAAPATVPQAATPATPAAVPAGGGRHLVQLGALNSEEAARGAWGRLQRQVPELAGRQPQVTRLEREGQPTLWRLRVGGLADAAAARALCEAVRAKGAACSTPNA